MVSTSEADPADLSIPLTRFIGREREVEEICALLGRGDVRLMTLTGPGGVGKTRLGLAAAAAFAELSNARLRFVDLALTSGPDFVLQAIAQRLDVREMNNELLEYRVAQNICEAPTLLLLDNFEHVIEAAPLLTRLLGACLDVVIVVTSRERLRVSGEQEFEVLPLALPDPDSEPLPDLLMQSEAVQFFVDRAIVVRPNFSLTPANAPAVASVCTHLDGLPLAIELAASRINALPPALLLNRLEQALHLLTSGGRDRPLRQQTMRNAIAWSYGLLSQDEQAAFRQFSIFRGGCTLEAAEYVVTSEATLETLLVLVDRSLLKHIENAKGSSRFQMLETTRQFGLEQLQTAGEFDATRIRHCHYYRNLADEQNLPLPCSGNFAWVERVEPDQGNLRLAFITADKIGDERGYLQLAIANYKLWRVRGFDDEVQKCLLQALGRHSAAPIEQYAYGYGELGEVAWFSGNYADATHYFERGFELAQQSGSAYAVASALHHLGGVAYRKNELDKAIHFLTEAAATYRSLGQTSQAAVGESLAISLMGDIAIVQGDFELAAERFERAVKLGRASNWHWIVPDALAGLGVVKLRREDVEGAVRVYLDGLEIASSGYVPQTVSILFGLAASAAVAGQLERAARLLGAAERLHENIGSVMYPRDQDMLSHCLTLLYSAFDEAQLTTLKRAECPLTLEQAMAEAKEIVPTIARAAAMFNGHAGRPFGLTPREIEVLRLVVEGYSDSRIAERLFITRRTVTTHTSNIFSKLGVSGRTEAAATAVRRGLV